MHLLGIPSWRRSTKRLKLPQESLLYRGPNRMQILALHSESPDLVITFALSSDCRSLLNELSGIDLY